MARKAQPKQKATRGGRRSAFREEYAEQAKKLCRLGAIDRELADFFGVCERTLHAWKKRHPEFLAALKEGKALADAQVAHSLYLRALGYAHPDVHVSRYQGEVTVTEIVKHYPPDTAACVFWLRNRCPDLWRERRVEEGDAPEARAFSFNVVDGRAEHGDAD